MAQMIIDLVANKLKDAAMEEIEFQWRLKDEIKELADELDYVKSSVKDASSSSSSSKANQEKELVQVTLEKAEEIATETEDLLEEFTLDMELLQLNTPSGSINFCEFNNMKMIILQFFKKALLRFHFHQQLNTIKKRLEDVKGKMKENIGGAQSSSSSSQDVHERSDHYHMEGSYVVGIEKEIEDLRQLVDDQKREEMLVITLWGPGGSGKTTRAEKVFEKLQEIKTIDCYALVYVNQTYDVKDVLNAMVNGFFGDDALKKVEKMDEAKVRVFIHEQLKHKRFVLILDDVWDTDFFTKIRVPTGKSSTIIITSRQKFIASGCFDRFGVAHEYVKVEALNPDISWDLFCKVAFRKMPHPSELIKELGRKLLGRCDGLPVAILAIAQLMARIGDDPREWKDVLTHLDSVLREDLVQLNGFLLVSYYHLPPHLKLCFLYCAMFPVGARVGVGKLIRLWIAEGFVKKDRRRTLENTARGYLKELVNRSMLQFKDENSNKGFKMHDLLRDVAIHMTEKESFGAVIHEDTTEVDSSNHRRLSFHATKPLFQLGDGKWKLRTLLANGSLGIDASFSAMLKNIKLIRTLDLEGVHLGNSIVPEVGDLINLRYLGLRGTGIKEMPDSVKNLRRLQTLDTRQTMLQKIPAGIAELEKLRHLHLFYSYLPVDVDVEFKFTQLQTLRGLCLSHNQARQLKSLKQLTKMDIILDCNDEFLAEITDAIKQMRDLRTLKLNGIRDGITLEGLSCQHLEKLTVKHAVGPLDSLLSHQYLREINLTHGVLLEDSFKNLGRVPGLRFLKIHYAYQGEELVCEPDGFPELEEFNLWSANKLKTWSQIPKDCMKQLRVLRISFCQKLEMLPDGMKDLHNLEMFYLTGMSEELTQRIQSGGVDHPKIQHIPRVKY